MSRKIYDRYRFSESRLRHILQFGINCSLKDIDRGIYHQMGFYFSQGTKLIFVLLDAHNYNLYFILDFEGNFPEALVNQLKTPDKVCFVVVRYIIYDGNHPALVFFKFVFKNLNLFYLSKSLCKQVSEIKEYTIVKKLCDYLSSFCHLWKKTKEEKQQGNPLHLFPLCEHYQVSNIQVRPNKINFLET